MPALSPTMEEGSIASWSKAEGEFVSAGEAVCEIETDKATVDFELADDGFLAKILVAAKDTDPNQSSIQVGQVIGLLVEEEKDILALKDVTLADVSAEQASESSTSAAPPVVDSPPVSPPASVPAPVVAPPSSYTPSAGTGRVFISPLARRTAEEAGIEVTAFHQLGTGPNGRVLYQDVLDYLAGDQHTQQALSSQASSSESLSRASEAAGEFIDVPALDGAALKNNLTFSKREVPHYFLNCEIDLSKVMALREEFHTTQDVEVSVNDFVLKAAAVAMKAVPYVNASFRNTFIRQFVNCHFNVYTQVRSGASGMTTELGLIRDVNSKGLFEISQEVAGLSSAPDGSEAADGDQKKLQMGTFSIINLGMYGVKAAHPIVVYGQSACLGIGSIEEELVPFVPKAGEEEISFEMKPKVLVSLSCDHRVVDGAIGAQWLQHFKKLMENPITMLL